MVDGQASQVVLDSLRELHWRIEAQHSSRQVPSRANLADQRQSLRVRMQRCPDELIRDIRTIELGGIDVIDAEFRGAPQHRNRLAAVSRRPEYPRTRQLHGAEADTRHGYRPQAIALLVTGHRLHRLPGQESLRPRLGPSRVAGRPLVLGIWLPRGRPPGG